MLSGVALFFGKAVLAAATSNEPHAVELTYLAPVGCPDRATWIGAIEQRVGALRLGEGASIKFDVTIEPKSDGGSKGTLKIGDEAPRVVSAASCAEVVDALAVIAALAIEAAPTTPAEEVEELTAAPSQPPAGLPVARDVAPPAAPPRDPPNPGRQVSLVGLGGAHVTTVPGIGSVLGLGGTIELWTDPRASTAVRLTVVRTDILRVSELSPLAWQRWTWTRVEACPLRLGARFLLQPCVGVTGGVLESGAGPRDTVEARTRPWLAVGAGVRGAVGGDPWIFSIEATATAPLLRDTFELERSQATYRIPAVLLSFSAGLGLRFW